MSSLFTFLQEVNERLYALALQAEADVWSNPRATLTQGRLFSEEMATTVSKMEKVEPVFYIKSNERIQLLARKDIISEELKDSFEWLRRNGNMAAHDAKPVPPDLALTAHRHLFTLALWYVESYGSLDIELPTYSMPTMPINQEHEQSEPKLDVSEQLEQLLSAQLEAKILPTLTEQFKHLHETITQVAGMNAAVAQPVTASHHAPTVSHADSMAPVSVSESGPERELTQSTAQQTTGATAGALEVGDYLAEQGMPIIDKRPNGGALWIVGGWELKDALFALKPHGIHFKFAKNGSQSTKRKPAWFMMGKDPTQMRYISDAGEALETVQVVEAITGIEVAAAQEVQESVAPLQSIPSVQVEDTRQTVNVHEPTELNEPTEALPAVDAEEAATSRIVTEVEGECSPEVSPPVRPEGNLVEAQKIEGEDRTELRKSFLNKELIFPASMIYLGLDDLDINGCASLVQYLKEDCSVTTLLELPEDLSSMTEKISGVGPKTIDRFVKQLEDAIVEEKRIIGSGKRKEQTVIAYRELKKELGRRPAYMELHQQAKVDSQEYRQLFDSYYMFLLQTRELDKGEVTIAKRYANWLKEVENTIIRKSYKMVLLLAMLERGAEEWMTPITAEEVAPLFYDYYMNDETRKKIDFSDNETQKLWDAPLDRTAQLIARMPMTHWAKGANKLLNYTDGSFKIGFAIKEADQELLYGWTREICEYRLLTYFERKEK